MMRYTSFGELFKIYRLKNNENLKDAADFLGVTSSFVSAVELGKRKIPKEWLKLITNHYKLSDCEVNEFEEAIEKSQKEISVNLDNTTALQRSVAIAFQRSFSTISDEDANKILKVFEEMNNNGLQDKNNIEK